MSSSTRTHVITRPIRTLTALVLASALGVAACSGGEDDPVAAEPDAPESTPTAPAEPEGSPSADAPEDGGAAGSTEEDAPGATDGAEDGDDGTADDGGTDDGAADGAPSAEEPDDTGGDPAAELGIDPSVLSAIDLALGQAGSRPLSVDDVASIEASALEATGQVAVLTIAPQAGEPPTWYVRTVGDPAAGQLEIGVLHLSESHEPSWGPEIEPSDDAILAEWGLTATDAATTATETVPGQISGIEQVIADRPILAVGVLREDGGLWRVLLDGTTGEVLATNPIEPDLSPTQ
ncbi:hypothetical protein ACPYO6_12600 [Georgenia sp. Z1344]|uniref:hypothetical protein n=1 Tax=Georgenia sp. Z1344 TaxID=3416706 RepID=UPI003CEDFB03